MLNCNLICCCVLEQEAHDTIPGMCAVRRRLFLIHSNLKWLIYIWEAIFFSSGSWSNDGVIAFKSKIADFFIYFFLPRLQSGRLVTISAWTWRKTRSPPLFYSFMHFGSIFSVPFSLNTMWALLLSCRFN